MKTKRYQVYSIKTIQMYGTKVVLVKKEREALEQGTLMRYD